MNNIDSLPATLAALDSLAHRSASLAQVLAKLRDAAQGSRDHSALHRIQLALYELATHMRLAFQMRTGEQCSPQAN